MGSNKYNAHVSSASSSVLTELRNTTNSYRHMLIAILTALLDRYESDPDYHFINTKLSLIDGKDYPCNDPIRGKNVIYSWIQGRGLEALARHALWLEHHDQLDTLLRTNLIMRIHRVISEVLSQMEDIRRQNNGRLFFMMTPDGTPVHLNAEGQIEPCRISEDSTYSDLFYVKGMASAAHLLGLSNVLDTACDWFLHICKNITHGKFISDQQQLDSKNIATKTVSGRNSHCPRMIGIGAASVMLKCTKNPEFAKIALDFLDYILKFHVNTGNKNTCSQNYDMWEFTDLNGNPYIDEKQTLLSDPGHACEFVGLALDILEASEKSRCLHDSQTTICKFKEILPNVLRQNFRNGFSRRGYGICKGYDLISRTTLNSDMPWWSLPETMRAAMNAYRIAEPEKRSEFEKIALACSNAFTTYYVKPSLNYMAIQTLNEAGQVVDIIPATPDADPGYHTGLSIIDFLQKL